MPQVGFRKLVADEEQTARMLFGDLIGEAITEIQSGPMHSLAPTFVGLSDASRRRCGYSHYVKTKFVDQVGHFFADVSAGSDDHGFRERSGGNQNLSLGFEGFDAGIRRWFCKD